MQAIIFCGLQAAGKSSFYKTYFFNTHIRINLDMLHTRRREDLLLAACIEMKQPFVVDNTNPSVKERAKYVSLARDAGFEVVCYYFSEGLEACLARNAERDVSQQIPVKGVLATYYKFQVPLFEENFHKLYHVRLADNNDFVIEEQPQN